ncbi:MAG: hypothetical protein PVS2B2_22090 [Candidatus Acidiferrum sp.]
MPLALLTVAGNYRLPDKYDVGQIWGSVELTNADYFLPYLVVWVTLMLMCAVVWLFTAREASSAKVITADLRGPLERALGLTMGVLTLEWLLMIHLSGGMEAFLTSHWYDRYESLVAQYGDRFVLLSHWMQASDVIFISAASLYASLSLRHGKTRKRFTALVVVFLLLQMVMTGNRIYIAIYLIAFLASCCQFKRKKALLGMLAASPALLLFFSAWSMVRHDLTSIPESLIAYSEGGEDSSVMSSLMDATEGLDLLLLLNIIHDYGPRREFLYGETYLRTLTAWVPRSLYPTKTENFTVLMAKQYLPNQETSLNATALGEMYANFGPFTLLLFPLLTMGVLSVNRWVQSRSEAHPILPALFFVMAIWIMRMAFADAIVLCVLCLIQIAILRIKTILRGVPGSSGGPAGPLVGEAVH